MSLEEGKTYCDLLDWSIHSVLEPCQMLFSHILPIPDIIPGHAHTGRLAFLPHCRMVSGTWDLCRLFAVLLAVALVGVQQITETDLTSGA